MATPTTHCTCRCRCHPGLCATRGRSARCGQCRKDGCYTQAQIAADVTKGQAGRAL